MGRYGGGTARETYVSQPASILILKDTKTTAVHGAKRRGRPGGNFSEKKNPRGADRGGGDLGCFEK